MFRKNTLLLLAFSTVLFFVACGESSTPKPSTKNNPEKEKPGKQDTLSNALQCTIAIDGKSFTIPADSISTSYTFSDSSLGITFRGLQTGRLIITIPNLFNCPYSIPTGFKSIRFKVAGTEEYASQPTAELYNYPVTGISFNNLDDGLHQKEIAADAIEVTGIQKINENTSTGWAEYILKGRIHTTVLKNVYESAAGNDNKDYPVSGSFVIQTKIYY